MENAVISLSCIFERPIMDVLRRTTTVHGVHLLLIMTKTKNGETAKVTAYATFILSQMLNTKISKIIA